MATIVPVGLVVTAAQRDEILTHAGGLRQQLSFRPDLSGAAEQATIAVLTKMFLTLAMQKTTAMQVEARGEAYQAALDDVPSWAVQEAIRLWYRGEHGKDHDYRWVPDPATLRALALTQAHVVEYRARELERIAGAVEAEPEPAPEHMDRMKKAMTGLMKAMKGGTLTNQRSFQDFVTLGDETKA